MTVFTNIAVMGIGFLALLCYKEHGWDHDVTEALKGIMMIFFQIMLLGGVSMCISVLLSPFVNFFLSFAIYLLGSMSSVTESLGTDDSKKNPAVVMTFKVLHVIIPNFGNFNIQNPIIHPDVVIHNETQYLVQTIMYALLWTAILMTGAVLAFDRREV